MFFLIFVYGPGDQCLILGRVILKTQKTVLDISLLNTQDYKVHIKNKVEQSIEGVVPSPRLWRRTYWKGSLQVAVDDSCQLLCSHTHTHTHTHTHIYIYIYEKFFLLFVVGPKKEKSKYIKINKSTNRFVFSKNYLFCSCIHVCFQPVAFVREHMWHKAIWIGDPMRLKLSRLGLLVCYIYIYIYIYKCANIKKTRY